VAWHAEWRPYVRLSTHILLIRSAELNAAR
jgi:hypothetical protein